LNFCLNRPATIEYIEDPKFKDKEADEIENYITCVSPGDYLATRPRFSPDYSRLVYFGSTEKFLSHTGNYQFKMIDWQGDRTKAKVVIDQSLEYPDDDAEFSGLYGY
jgi:hypothetical protein